MWLAKKKAQKYRKEISAIKIQSKYRMHKAMMLYAELGKNKGKSAIFK